MIRKGDTPYAQEANLVNIWENISRNLPPPVILLPEILINFILYNIFYIILLYMLTIARCKELDKGEYYNCDSRKI